MFMGMLLKLILKGCGYGPDWHRRYESIFTHTMSCRPRPSLGSTIARKHFHTYLVPTTSKTFPFRHCYGLRQEWQALIFQEEFFFIALVRECIQIARKAQDLFHNYRDILIDSIQNLLNNVK